MRLEMREEKTRFHISGNKREGMITMEKNQKSSEESPLPMLVLLIMIFIGMIVLIRFIFLS
jgi:hypothetical protein